MSFRLFLINQNMYKTNDNSIGFVWKRYQSIRRTMTGRGSRDFHSTNANHNQSHNSNSDRLSAPNINALIDNLISPVSDQTDAPPTTCTTPAATTTTTTLTPTTAITTTTTSSSTTTTTSSSTAATAQTRAVLDLPAVRFLTRTDFFNLMHMNDDALAQYNSSSSLKHMVTKIRREGQHSIVTAFDRYQHNRDLVSLINKFAETHRELPTGIQSLKRDFP